MLPSIDSVSSVGHRHVVLDERAAFEHRDVRDAVGRAGARPSGSDRPGGPCGACRGGARASRSSSESSSAVPSTSTSPSVRPRRRTGPAAAGSAAAAAALTPRRARLRRAAPAALGPPLAALAAALAAAAATAAPAALLGRAVGPEPVAVGVARPARRRSGGRRPRPRGAGAAVADLAGAFAGVGPATQPGVFAGLARRRRRR